MTEQKQPGTNGADPLATRLDQLLELLTTQQEMLEEIVEKLNEIGEGGTGFSTEFES